MFVGAMVDDTGYIQTRDVYKHVNIMISVFLFAGNQRLAIIHELSRVKMMTFSSDTNQVVLDEFLHLQ